MSVAAPARRARRGARRVALALLALLLGGGLSLSTMDDGPPALPTLSVEVAAGLPIVDSATLPAPVVEPVIVTAPPAEPIAAQPQPHGVLLAGRLIPSTQTDRAPPRRTV